MKTPALLTSAALTLALSGCFTIPETEYEIPPVEAPSTGASTTSPSTMGAWAGTMVYYLPNGETSSISMSVKVGPSRHSITFVTQGSDVETCIAKWNGNTVSWSSSGEYPSFTVFSLAALGARSAKMTSTCTLRNGLRVSGSGTFIRQ